jgi:hypothetical protein
MLFIFAGSPMLAKVLIIALPFSFLISDSDGVLIFSKKSRDKK